MAKGVATATAAATAAVGAMGYALSKQVQKVDDLAKTAKKLGTTVATLQELQYAADISGVSADTLNMAMQRLTRRVSEASMGFGEAKGALKELGINAAQLNKLPLDKKMEVLADAFENVATDGDKVRLAMKLFDSEGVALVNTLSLGSEGLREMSAEAQSLGLSISEIDAQRFEKMQDDITRMKTAAGAAATTFTTELLPLIEGLFNGFNDAGFGATNFQKTAVSAAHTTSTAFGFLADILYNLQLSFNVLRSVALTAVDSVVNVLNDAMKGWTDNYNAIMRLMGQPTIENPMADFAVDIKVAAAEARIAFRALRDEGLPSDAIKQYIADYQAAGNNTANVTKGMIEETKKLTFFEKMRALGQREQSRIAEHEMKAKVDGFAKQTAAIAAHSKQGFAIDKGVKIAQAVMNTYQGATLALASYPGPVGVAMAAMTVAAGMANVATIKAQKFQGSFEGGGFTGMGARVGGVDGKGGFPAILHPNETVVDHTKGQGMGTNVNITIQANDTKGFDELLYKRRGQLVNIINQAMNNRGRASLA
tara:strand:- start:1836 stop:3449 length:1614 start_codon:yes stop_codon:yes gene_type:complete